MAVESGAIAEAQGASTADHRALVTNLIKREPDSEPDSPIFKRSPGTTPSSLGSSPAVDEGRALNSLPSAVKLSAPAKFRGQHPPAVWESLKPEIHRLYIDDELPLKEVREIMMHKGFVATEKMYKDKFAKWGYTKNNRRKDVAKMVQLEKQRKAFGKKTMFQRNGKVVDIDTYIKRAKLSSSELESLNAAEELPVIVRVRTPPPTRPIPSNLRPPGFLDLQQLLVKSFGDLSARSESVLGSKSALEVYANYPRTDFYQTVRHLRDASWLFEEGCNAEAGIFMRRAFNNIHKIIENPDPWALCDLLMYQMAFTHYGHQRLIWKYLSEYSAVVRGPVPWLSGVLQALREFFDANPIEMCMEFLAELMGMIYPSMVLVDLSKKSLISFLQGYINSVSRFRSYPNPAVERFAHAIEAPALPLIKQELEPDHPLLRIHALYTLGEQSDWHDERVLDLATDLHRTETDVNSRRLCLRALAYYHMSQWKDQPTKENPRHGYARQYLRQAIDLAPYSTFGGLARGSQREVWGDMKFLEQWYREGGDMESAAELETRRQEGLSEFVNSIQTSPT
ncbi:hypothetical protein JX265_003622 [Neoarthrinium moseri]|uniref:Clr5 domain-containing protein n=1 Tax=Neoarthrinium moseri TaxID=1658444 RepID=A0A9P9WSL4_9PEZI|nr:hypothetical protein JX266_001195 [Neoarthrinium moseri]KAI1877614.1 hypothetical protein JX265_003622 [Neoarthrinium moseri]